MQASRASEFLPPAARGTLSSNTCCLAPELATGPYPAQFSAMVDAAALNRHLVTPPWDVLTFSSVSSPRLWILLLYASLREFSFLMLLVIVFGSGKAPEKTGRCQ